MTVGAFLVGLAVGGVLVLLASYLITRAVLAELERRNEALESELEEARHAASDWMEIAERQADELKALKGPRPRRPARWN